MLIKIEEIAAKNIIKFFAPQPLLKANTAVFLGLGDSKFTDNILTQDGVEWALLTDEILAVKHDGAKTEELKATVLAELADYIESGNTLKISAGKADVQEFAEALADVFIRPTLNKDGGDLKLDFALNGDLAVEFVGHCAGCPYAQNTLQNVVIKTLQKYIPSINKIYLKETA